MPSANGPIRTKNPYNELITAERTATQITMLTPYIPFLLREDAWAKSTLEERYKGLAPEQIAQFHARLAKRRGALEHRCAAGKVRLQIFVGTGALQLCGETAPKQAQILKDVSQKEGWDLLMVASRDICVTTACQLGLGVRHMGSVGLEGMQGQSSGVYVRNKEGLIPSELWFEGEDYVRHQEVAAVLAKRAITPDAMHALLDSYIQADA